MVCDTLKYRWRSAPRSGELQLFNFVATKCMSQAANTNLPLQSSTLRRQYFTFCSCEHVRQLYSDKNHALQRQNCLTFFPATSTCMQLQKNVSHLVGTLSPVDHKGLYQGEKQTSICLLVILHTSHQTKTSLNPTKSIRTQIYIELTRTNIKYKIFEEVVPSVLPMFKLKNKKTKD